MKVKKLIHKDCGGRIFISVSDVEGQGEGYCKKCNETINCREQIDWKKSKIKDDGQLVYHT